MWPPFCNLRLEKKLFISLYWCLQLTHTLLTPWSSTWNVYETKKNTDLSHTSYAQATRKCIFIYIYTRIFSFCFTHIGICLLWKGLLGSLSKRYHLSLSGLLWLPRKEKKKLTASIQRKDQNTQMAEKEHCSTVQNKTMCSRSSIVQTMNKMVMVDRNNETAEERSGSSSFFHLPIVFIALPYHKHFTG